MNGKIIHILLEENGFKGREHEITTDWMQVRLKNVLAPLIAKYGESFLSDKDIYTLTSNYAKEKEQYDLLVRYPDIDSVIDELSFIQTDLYNM